MVTRSAGTRTPPTPPIASTDPPTLRRPTLSVTTVQREPRLDPAVGVAPAGPPRQVLDPERAAGLERGAAGGRGAARCRAAAGAARRDGRRVERGVERRVRTLGPELRRHVAPGHPGVERAAGELRLVHARRLQDQRERGAEAVGRAARDVRRERGVEVGLEVGPAEQLAEVDRREPAVADAVDGGAGRDRAIARERERAAGRLQPRRRRSAARRRAARSRRRPRPRRDPAGTDPR